MIHGVGIDIVQIGRLRRSVENSGRKFLERVFTEDEIAYCHKRRDPFPSLAARFAAKEAFIKAITTPRHISLTDVEVSISPEGKPSVRITEKLEGIFHEQGIRASHLSLSHEREYAVACVVLEGGSK